MPNAKRLCQLTRAAVTAVVLSTNEDSLGPCIEQLVGPEPGVDAPTQ